MVGLERIPSGEASGAAAAARWARTPLPCALLVFAPLALTTAAAYLIGQGMAAAMRYFLLFPFLLYVGANWLVIAVGRPLLGIRGITWRDLGFTRFRLRDAVLALAAAATGIFIVYPLAGLLAQAVGLEPIRGMSYSLNNPVTILSAILVLSLAGPLAEDIIFRGFLLGLLRDKLGSPWLAGVIGVLAFTIIHVPYFGWAGALFILLWSPLSVGLFLWRKSIYPPLILHVANNLVAYVIIPVFFRR
jgi:membrane protease YdiL (CAAX protease family)